jgi:hypothetical protein
MVCKSKLTVTLLATALSTLPLPNYFCMKYDFLNIRNKMIMLCTVSKNWKSWIKKKAGKKVYKIIGKQWNNLFRPKSKAKPSIFKKQEKKFNYKETAGYKAALKLFSGRRERERARKTMKDMCLKILSPKKMIIAICVRTAYKVEIED